MIGTGAEELHPDALGSGSGQGAAAREAARAAGAPSAKTLVNARSAVVPDDDDTASSSATAFGGASSSLAPKAQTVVTACWLTMKEVSLLVGALSRAAPVEGDDEDAAAGGSPEASSDDERDDDDKKKGRRRPRKKSASPLLDPSQLRDAGERLLATLLAMKHNGAIEKTRVGLTCLGERLLRSSDATLSALPKAWLAELFERLEEPNQSVKDLIRRSAGIPFGFMAVFLAEPGGAPRHLLHEAMEKLLAVAVRAIFFLRAFRPSVSPSLPLASLSFRAAKRRRRRKPGSLYRRSVRTTVG